MSLNYLNLASLIDNYGGVDVDISRAERNALNGMVGSKKNQLQAQVGSGLLSQAVVDMLATENYLTDFGPQTHLNGLQAVGFGWLQYDSVYNCCERDAKVISALFGSVGADAAEKIVFYTNEGGAPENANGKRLINLDSMTDEDHAFLREEMAPIFQMAYNNLSEEEITAISTALCKVAYQAARSGVNIFANLDTAVLPLEAKNPYDVTIIHNQKLETMTFNAFEIGSAEAVENAYRVLSNGGVILEPLHEVPWSKCCATVIDKYGVCWWISI